MVGILSCCRVAVATLTILTVVTCADLSDAEWEQLLNTLGGPSEPRDVATTSVETLQAQNFVSPSLGANTNRLDDPSQQPEQLATSISSLPAQEAREPVQPALQAPIRVREMSQEERRQTLRRLQSHLYLNVGGRRQLRRPIFQPFAGGITQRTFSAYLRELLDLPGTFGLWPYSVTPDRFMLHQIRGGKSGPIFEAVNGFKHDDTNKLLLGVWQDVGRPGVNMFQYIGVLQGLDHRRMREFRMNVRSKTTTPLVAARPLSASTFIATFAPPKDLSKGSLRRTF